jgi:hypothetical protein
MDVYLESMERIMADIVTLRFGVKSHDHKSSRSNQAHWQVFLCYMYAYTGPPNKRVSVHSRDPRPDNVPEDWVIDHIDRDIQQHTGEFVVSQFNAFNAKRPIQGASGVHFVQSRRIASELKARAVFTLATSALARGRNRFGNLLRTQVWQVGRNHDLLFTRDQSSPGALLSLKSFRYREHRPRGALACAYDHHQEPVSIDQIGPFRARYGTQYLGS